MTNHIQRLKTALFQSSREVSLKHALLYTASHQQTEGEPIILRRAKATAYIFEHVEISIRGKELIAGNRIVEPRAGIMSPEMDPYWLFKELEQLPTRPQGHLGISGEDKHLYRGALYPYWEKRSIKDLINDQVTDEVKAAVSTRVFGINQTGKGQGYIIIGCPRLLNHRLGELVAQIRAHCLQQPENHFYQVALLLLEALQNHILRYAMLAEKMMGNCPNAQRRQELLTTTENPWHNAQSKPQAFWQVYQLFWYMNIVLQYESNVNSLSFGRLDRYMLSLYQASLTQGEDPAFLQETLESLWVKCNDIVPLRFTSSACYFVGFPMGYIALLGGLAEDGRNAVNALSFLCLDAYQNVQLPRPNLGVRTSALIDTPSLMKTAQTIRLGTGTPQIFNDEVVVPVFLNRGVSLEGTWDCAVVGCVGLFIPDRTYGLHDIAIFNLSKVMEACLHENEGNHTLAYDDLLAHTRAKINHYITLMAEDSNIYDIGHRDRMPVLLLSSFINDCSGRGCDVTGGDARYSFSGVQGVDIANLSDSLYVLNGLVFRQQYLFFDELLSVPKNNFAAPEGEKIRARLINHFEKYGNNIDNVGSISTRLLCHYCKEVEKYQGPCGGQFTPGSYTVFTHVPLGSVVRATPGSRFVGEQLADGGLSPMLGQDMQGPTAVLKSASRLDSTLLSDGMLLNVKFTPATLEGEAGLRKLADFLRAFTQLKLQHIQFNVVNTDTLREAQQHPQDFARLVVHMAGYSAFFVELSKEIQDDIIRRTAHQL